MVVQGRCPLQHMFIEHETVVVIKPGPGIVLGDELNRDAERRAREVELSRNEKIEKKRETGDTKEVKVELKLTFSKEE